LLVWNFEEGKFDSAKPLWIKREEIADKYNLLKFTKGRTLKTIEDHRVFNIQKQKFTSGMTKDTPIGTKVFTDGYGYVKLKSKKVIHKQVKFYNIITYYHMNLFANGMLTSCRLSNLYAIKDMKYVKDNRQLRSKSDFNLPDKYYYGLRLAEQQEEISTQNNLVNSSIKDYVNKMIRNKK
jgi:hypothetical protein